MTTPGDAGPPAQPVPDPGPAPVAPGPSSPAAAPAPQAAAPVHPHRLRRTRAGGVWVGLALAAVVLLLLLVFILENGEQVKISYFGAHGHIPLGVALLLAAVAGALLVIIPGTMRILQLRRTARRHRAADIAAVAPGSPPAGGMVAGGTEPPGR